LVQEELTVKKLILAVLAVSLVGNLGAGVLLDRALFWRAQLTVMLEANRMHEARNDDDLSAQEKVLFLGDSIFAGFPLRAFLPAHCELLNCGVGGDGMGDIAGRYRDLSGRVQHDVLVMQGGINDILGCVSKGRNEEETLNEVVQHAQTVVDRAGRNGREVYLVSTLPVTDRFALPHLRSVPLPTAFDEARVNRLVIELNRRIQALATGHARIHYVDVHAAVLRDGRFDRRYAAADGYHVNVYGYARMASVLNREVFASPAHLDGGPKVAMQPVRTLYNTRH
jgi:lysophospholipase L1-like esterase